LKVKRSEEKLEYFVDEERYLPQEVNNRQQKEVRGCFLSICFCSLKVSLGFSRPLMRLSASKAYKPSGLESFGDLGLGEQRQTAET
ncbi:MAG: hypothetical protein QXZ60_04495, partial [Sulfolobales archaeon]